MRAIVTAVVAAIEGCAAAVAGIAVIAIPAVLLWVVTFGIAAEPQDVAAAVAGTWLLAHLVPMEFSLTQDMMLAMGIGPDPLTFTLSLAPLAVTLVSVAFAVRAGLRLSKRGGVGAAGLLGGALGFAAVTFAVVHVSGSFSDWPVLGATIVPAAVYLVPAAVAFVISAAVADTHWWRLSVRGMQRGLEYLGIHGGIAAFPARAAMVCRLVAGSLAGLIGVAGVALAVALAVGFADVIAIAQALQLDGVGSILLFLAQLAVLPIGVVWALAWLSGAGFDAGGLFSPFTEATGALPSLPLLGALPGGWGAFGAVAPMLLVLVSLAVGVLLAQRSELRRASWPVALTLSVIAAAVTGVAAAGLSMLGSGSMGPGRLAAAGPDPWLTGGLIAAEVAVGLLLGVSAARVDYSRVQQALPEPLARWNADRAAASAAATREVRPEDAETVDLSRVRGGLDGEPAGADEWMTEQLGDTAPVVDLFEGVLHARGHVTELDAEWGAELDAERGAGLDAELDAEFAGEHGADAGTSEADPDQEAALNSGTEPRPEPEVFDIETADAEAVDVAATADLSQSAVKGELDDAEVIARAFAWDADDATDSVNGLGAPGNAAGSEKPRGRFGLSNWRGPRRKS